jgi:hypothetical protein
MSESLRVVVESSTQATTKHMSFGNCFNYGNCDQARRHRVVVESREAMPLSFGNSTTEDSVATVKPKPKAKVRKNPMKQSRFDFTKVDAVLLPIVFLVVHPSILR